MKMYDILMEHGFVDAIAPRNIQKQLITDLLQIHCGDPEEGEIQEIQNETFVEEA